MSLEENISHCFREYPKMKLRIEILEEENQQLQAEVARLKDLPLEVAKRILAARDAMVAKDTDDAYNEIYWLNDMIESDPFKPWKDMEANVNLRTRIAELEAIIERTNKHEAQRLDLQSVLAYDAGKRQATEAALRYVWNDASLAGAFGEEAYGSFLKRGRAALLGEKP